MRKFKTDRKSRKAAREAKRDAVVRSTMDAIRRVEFVARWADAEYEAVLRETAQHLRYADDEMEGEER